MELVRNGYHDVPPGTIVTVVTFLEMTERPAPRPVPPRPDLALRRVERPDPVWYRDLYRRVGEDWLWFSRLRLTDQELARVIRHPRVEIWALSKDGMDVGLLELDRRTPGEVELLFFGLTPGARGRRCRPLPDGAGASRSPGRRRRGASGFTPARWTIRQRWRSTGAPGFRAYRQTIEIDEDPRLTGELPPGAAPARPHHSLSGRQLETGVSGWAPHSDQDPS